MIEALNTIQRLHAVYCEVTRLQLRLDSYREYQWFEWARRLGGLEDAASRERELRGVVAWIQRGIREQRRQPGALRFHNLIGQADLFEEDLAEARSTARTRAAAAEGKNPKAQVMREASILEGENAGNKVKKAGEIAAQLVSDPEKAKAAFEQFKKLRETL